MKRYKPLFNEDITQDQTQTPEFKKWFGHSKVVKNGKPLIVYHGTKSNFSVFKPSNKMGNQGEIDQLEGMYFTDSIDGASFYALDDSPKFLKKVYLSIQKPFMAKTYNELKEIFKIEDITEIGRIIKKKGYDGIFIEKGFYSNGGPWKLFLAFYPKQIKSATDNTGNFSKNSDNINESII